MDFLNANDYEMVRLLWNAMKRLFIKRIIKHISQDGDVIEVVQFMGGGCGTSLMYRSIM